MEASKILFRCSGLSKIMANGNVITEKQIKEISELETKASGKGLTENQSKELERLINKRDNTELSDGVKTHLIDVFANYKYGRREEIKNKFLDKGNEREEDSITLLSRIKKTFYKKNTIRLKNNFIQGEPDLFEGDEITKATNTIDTKTSWSLHTFLRTKYKALDDEYYWQGQGYMDLTGAQTHTVAFCLVNGTASIIMAEKNALIYKYKSEDITSPEMKARLRQIEVNHIFDIKSFYDEYPGFMFDNDVDKWQYDIPMQDRLFTFSFKRNDADIKKMHDRVLQCREFMESQFFNNN